jgi:hypothetical protein
LSTVCLSMYNITENIYYSQLSSVAILLQPEPNCFTSYNTRKGLCSLSLCAIVLRSPPAYHVSTSNGQRSSQLFCVHYKLDCSSSKDFLHIFKFVHTRQLSYELKLTVRYVKGEAQTDDFNKKHSSVRPK